MSEWIETYLDEIPSSIDLGQVSLLQDSADEYSKRVDEYVERVGFENLIRCGV